MAGTQLECTRKVHSTLGLFRGMVLSFLFGITQGCYAYPVVTTAPAPGRQLQLDLNDRGRVGLGGSIGPSTERVEGVLQADLDTAYSVKVVSVSYTNGQTSKWSGEPLVISKEFVRTVREREFSRSRTFLTVAATVGGILLFIATRGLFGSGTPETNPPPPGPGGENFR